MLEPVDAMLVRPDWAARVVSAAYDAYSPVERRRFAEENRDLFLNVTRSPDDYLDDDPPQTTHQLLAAGSASLQRLLDAGAYEPRPPAMYLYRLQPRTGEPLEGVVGVVPLDEYDAGRILRHEAVRDRRADVLASHLEIVGATSSPVALTAATGGALEDALAGVDRRHPVLDFVGADGMGQTVWALSGHDAATIRAALDGRVLYITDGHHRMAAASRRRAAVGRGTPLDHIQVVVFADSALTILPFHRRVARAEQDLLGALEPVWQVEATDSFRRPERRGEIAMYLGGSWYRLTCTEVAAPDPVSRLDTVVLHRHLLGPVLGLEEGDPDLEYVADPVGVDELVRRCDGDGGVAFVLHPITVADLIAVAESGRVMPPKSSYFDPKPRSGVFLRVLDRGG